MKKIMMVTILVLSLMLVTSSVMAYTYLGSFVKNSGNYNWTSSSSYTGDAFTLDHGGEILTSPLCDNIDEYARFDGLEISPYGLNVGLTGNFLGINLPSNSGNNYVWFTFPFNNVEDIPDYYLVKGGSCELGNNVSQLYGVDPNNPNDSTSFYDFFDTCRGDCDLSHISFYHDQCNPVPIPASILLLASGVLGIIGVRRRKKDKS